MQALFGFLAFAAMVLMVIGVIWPRITLPWSKAPTRLKAFGSNFLVLVVVVGIGLAVVPQSDEEKSPQQVPAAETPTAPVQAPVPEPAKMPPPASEPMKASKGIGVSRAKALQFFGDLGFTQQKGQPIKGDENWTGRAGTALSQVVGPEADVTSMTLTCIMSKDSKANEKNVLFMAMLLSYTLPEWKEGMGWLTEAIRKHGDETEHDGRMLKMSVVEEIGTVFLTISAGK